MEVVDQRDGKRLFYGAGRLHVACGQNTILRMTGTSAWDTQTKHAPIPPHPRTQPIPNHTTTTAMGTPSPFTKPNPNQPTTTTTTARKEVAEPFSAADRDPGPERFETLKECMKGAHNPLYPISIRVRVFICDDVRGRFSGFGFGGLCLCVREGPTAETDLSTPPTSHHTHHHPHTPISLPPSNSAPARWPSCTSRASPPSGTPRRPTPRT